MTSIEVGCATRSLYSSSGPKAQGVATNNLNKTIKMELMDLRKSNEDLAKRIRMVYYTDGRNISP